MHRVYAVCPRAVGSCARQSGGIYGQWTGAVGLSSRSVRPRFSSWDKIRHYGAYKLHPRRDASPLSFAPDCKKKTSYHCQLVINPNRHHIMASKELVLVTGGSGFVASHCILELLRQNYRVRTTLRSLKRREEVLGMLKVGGATEDQANGVEFAVADLTKDDGWVEACKGCAYVLHVASPFPATAPKHPDDLIVPAREGTLRALRAAKEAGSVRRVVITSSFAAIGKSTS